MDVLGMMRARDERAARQAALLKEFGRPLVSFTMNIAGPEKTNALIEKAFRLAVRRLKDALAASGIRLVHGEMHMKPSGPEGFFCVDGGVEAVKRLCVALEERDKLGRLLDLDVLDRGGGKLSREQLELPARGCVICGKTGSYCAASRAHSAETLFEEAMGRIAAALDAEADEAIAALAARALLTELAVTPKPGLVDRNNNGAHRDMDCHTFMASAAALQPYFSACARLGRELGAGEECFQQLRLEGMLAEGKMLRANGGVNTHKGAIFTLGILAAAAGHLVKQGLAPSPENLSAAAIAMTATALEQERAALSAARTYGEALMRGRLSGARAEAAAGFPTVMGHGLPALDGALGQGLTRDEAGARALLVIMLKAEDTVLLRRAGEQGAREALARVKAALVGGARPRDLLELDQYFISEGLSPGGSADLLAAVFFVRYLRELSKEQ